MRCAALVFVIATAGAAGCDRHTDSRPRSLATDPSQCEPAVADDALATGLKSIVARLLGAVPAS